MSDLIEAVIAIRAKEKDIDEAYAFAEGEVREFFTSANIRALIGQSGGKFKINFAGRVVAAVTDRLNISSISVPGNDDDTEKITAMLDTVEAEFKLPAVIKDTIITGNGWLMVWDDGDSGVTVNVNHPRNMYMAYEKERADVPRYAAKYWVEGTGEDQQIRVNLYYPDTVERYISAKGAVGDDDKDYAQYSDEEGAAWPLVNPYGAIPVFKLRSDYPDGKPEHRDAYGPQNALTKLAATQMATADYHGFPQRWRMLNPDKVNPDLFVAGDDNDDDPYEDAGLAAGAGKMWDLTDTTAVGEFSVANPDAFLKPMDWYARALATVTDTPLRLIDPLSANTSGESRRQDEAPFIRKVRRRAALTGNDIEKAIAFAMKILGTPDVKPVVTWEPFQTIDDLQGWQTIQTKVASGVPLKQTLTEAGYLPDQIDKWAADSEETSFKSRLDSLEQIGKILQSLGAGIALGAVDAGTVNATVDVLITDAIGER